MRTRTRATAGLAGAATTLALLAALPVSSLTTAGTAVAAGPECYDPHDHGTASSSAKLTAEAVAAGRTEKGTDAAYARSVRRGEGKAAYRAKAAAAAKDFTVDIPVHVHVIQKSATEGLVSDTAIADQIAVLNQAFAGELDEQDPVDSGYSFTLVDTDRTINPAWYGIDLGDAGEAPMKNALREGGKRTLNLYFTETRNGTLGWATFPDEYAARPKLDGVVVQSSTLPGGDNAPYNLGATASHEVGHWLGLFHTFQDGCEGGDLVADTAPEASSASGCPEGRDTCTEDDLVDPIHNFMDYSDDECLYEFTQGQVDRVDAQTAQFRNTAPGFAPAALSTTGPTPVSATISDPEGDTFTAGAASTPANGTVTRSGNTYTYTAKAGFSGRDSFAVTATDRWGTTSTSTVTVDVVSLVAPATILVTGKDKIRANKFLNLTVNVTTAAPRVAVGRVQVFEGSKLLGTTNVIGAPMKLQLAKKLKPGKHTLTVVYGGSPTVAASQTTYEVKVKKNRKKKN